MREEVTEDAEMQFAILKCTKISFLISPFENITNIKNYKCNYKIVSEIS